MLLPLGRHIARGIQARRYMWSLVLIGDDVCELENNCCRSESTAKTLKGQAFHFRVGERVVRDVLLLVILSCFSDDYLERRIDDQLFLDKATC